MVKHIPKVSGDYEINKLLQPTHLVTKSRGKKNRKQRKLNEKEIREMFFDESRDREQYFSEISNDSVSSKMNMHKSSYNNILYLSHAERESFESKFLKPKNESQEKYVNSLKDKKKKIVIANGPAGTGKTVLATEYGIKYFLTNVYDKLIFTRPSVSVDEDLGYLPGTLEEKMAPWLRPIYDVLYRFLSPKEVTQLMEDKTIEIAPLGYMRGRTFQNAWIIADEMQNSTVSQMKMLMTRLGQNSRLIITGDLEQHDKNFEINGLEDFLKRFHGKRSDSISSFEFERSDIQREQVVKEILDIYGGDIPEYSYDFNSRSDDEDFLLLANYS